MARRAAAAIVAAALLFAAGAVTGALVPAVGAMVAEAKRSFRETLGLPKQWRPLEPSNRRGRAAVSCPDPETTIVIATGGQSQAANSNSSLSATRQGDGVFEFFDGACFVAIDPILGNRGPGGSLWPDLGLRIATATGRPVLFVHGAVGGSQVSDWLDPRSGYLDAWRTRLAAARRQGYEPRWIVWTHGETDAAARRPPERFERELRQLLDEVLAAAPEARIYYLRSTVCRGEGRAEGVPELVAAQTRVAEANPRIVAGLLTDSLGPDFRWDGCHFNSRGRAAINPVLARDLLRLGL